MTERSPRWVLWLGRWMRHRHLRSNCRRWSTCWKTWCSAWTCPSCPSLSDKMYSIWSSSLLSVVVRLGLLVKHLLVPVDEEGLGQSDDFHAVVQSDGHDIVVFEKECWALPTWSGEPWRLPPGKDHLLLVKRQSETIASGGKRLPSSLPALWDTSSQETTTARKTTATWNVKLQWRHQRSRAPSFL